MLLYFASNFGAKIQLIINKVKEIIKNFRNLRNAGGGETANRSRLSETKRIFNITLVAVEINATFDENFDYTEIAREKYVKNY